MGVCVGGGLQNGRRGGGGQFKFHPYPKKMGGGGQEQFSHVGVGAQNVLWYF